MAEETPRSSTRVKKYTYKTSISKYQESPLGATPRPDLYQHYPTPPPPVELKTVTFSHNKEEFGGHNDSNFTHLRKKTEYTQVKEWIVDHKELKPEGSTRKAMFILAFIFVSALIALGVVYSNYLRA